MNVSSANGGFAELLDQLHAEKAEIVRQGADRYDVNVRMQAAWHGQTGARVGGRERSPRAVEAFAGGRA